MGTGGREDGGVRLSVGGLVLLTNGVASRADVAGVVASDVLLHGRELCVFGGGHRVSWPPS